MSHLDQTHPYQLVIVETTATVQIADVAIVDVADVVYVKKRRQIVETMGILETVEIAGVLYVVKFVSDLILGVWFGLDTGLVIETN